MKIRLNLVLFGRFYEYYKVMWCLGMLMFVLILIKFGNCSIMYFIIIIDFLKMVL